MVRLLTFVMCDVYRFIPKYFEKDIESGMPRLTEAGRRAVEEELKEDLLVTSASAKPTLSTA